MRSEGRWLWVLFVVVAFIKSSGLRFSSVQGRFFLSALHSTQGAETAPAACTASQRSSANRSTQRPQLTQREYYSTVRNRLYAVEERLWLHEYALLCPEQKLPLLTERNRADFLRTRDNLQREYPMTKLQDDMAEAIRFNLSHAELHLRGEADTLRRQLPLAIHHSNVIAAASDSPLALHLIRGNGHCHYALLLPAPVVSMRVGLERRLRLPVFSSSGLLLAVVDQIVNSTSQLVSSSRVLVYHAPTSPKAFASKLPSPAVIASSALPASPVRMRFSASDDQLVIATDLGIHALCWPRFQGESLSKPFRRCRLSDVALGQHLTFGFSTASALNQTIVVGHQNAEDDWFSSADHVLPMSTRGEIVCHSAGGGDNAIVLAGDLLQTVAISPWKRGHGLRPLTKTLMLLSGTHAHWVVAPDSRRMAVLEAHPQHNSLFILDGEETLDPAGQAPAAPRRLDIPGSAWAAWFSPDSSKLLLLVSTEDDRPVMRWLVFVFLTDALVPGEEFVPTHEFLSSCRHMQLWAPDSKSFIYMAPQGLVQVSLAEASGSPPASSLGQSGWAATGVDCATWAQ